MGETTLVAAAVDPVRAGAADVIGTGDLTPGVTSLGDKTAVVGADGDVTAADVTRGDTDVTVVLA